MRMAALIMAGFAALPALGGEVVVLGRVSEIVMLPEGHARCEPRCPVLAGSKERTCISNSCGCGEATIEVEEVIVGTSGMRIHTAPYQLGEWCMADFPLSGERILVRTEADESRWSPVHQTSDGEVWFEMAPFETSVGSPFAQLPTTEGRVRLTDMRAASDL
jgi:hypothetical protein